MPLTLNRTLMILFSSPHDHQSLDHPKFHSPASPHLCSKYETKLGWLTDFWTEVVATNSPHHQAMHLNPAFSHVIALYVSLPHAQTPFILFRLRNSVNYCNAVVSKSLWLLNCLLIFMKISGTCKFHFPVVISSHSSSRPCDHLNCRPQTITRSALANSWTLTPLWLSRCHGLTANAWNLEMDATAWSRSCQGPKRESLNGRSSSLAWVSLVYSRLRQLLSGQQMRPPIPKRAATAHAWLKMGRFLLILFWTRSPQSNCCTVPVVSFVVPTRSDSVL